MSPELGVTRRDPLERTLEALLLHGHARPLAVRSRSATPLGSRELLHQRRHLLAVVFDSAQIVSTLGLGQLLAQLREARAIGVVGPSVEDRPGVPEVGAGR